MSLRFLAGSDDSRGDIANLWKLCFGDSDEYIRFYLDELFIPGQVLLAFEGETPVAMLTMMPICATTPDGGRLDGRYVFAVATHPDCQGRGISTALLDEAHRRMAADGADFSVLVPAGDRLFSFYGKRGYKTAFCLDFKEYAGGKIPPGDSLPLRAAQSGEMLALRGEYFSKSALYCGWPRETFHRMLKECRYHGGQAWAVDTEGGPAYAVCYPAGDTLLIKECVPSEAAGEILPALHALYKKPRYIVRTQPRAGEGRAFGMCRWYTEPVDLVAGSAPYLSLVLD